MGHSNYTGPVKGVILDWAGTAVDCGCLGPVAVFSRAFEAFGLRPTIEEIRKPMGMEKRAHVDSMLNEENLGSQWQAAHGHKPGSKDVDLVFAKVIELMPATLADYATPVAGCEEALAKLRQAGIKIGSCTGYSRSMMTELIPLAKEKGFSPDCLVTADEVPQGRPYPWMCWKNCMELGIFPPAAVVKVGDTVADIQEGLNAGCWSVAVTRTSNSMGLNEKDAAAMDQGEMRKKEKELADKFRAAGAHYVISSISELPQLCAEISERLSAGEKP